MHFPMLKLSWLNQIQGELKINQQSRTGTVVGFVQGTSPYQVVMDSSAISSSTKLIYFDATGRMTDAKSGQPGGGFILFNVPEGMRSIAVQPEGAASRYYLTTALVDSAAVSIIGHSIR
jgi:hypothetical protein